MREPSRFQIWYGRDEPPVEPRELRAGPLTALLDGIDLRYVRVGNVEALRRLFAAIRDAGWGTIPPRIGNLEVDAGSDSFRVSFDATHEAGQLRFRWRGQLAGHSDGSVECSLDGFAESDFEYNRIGFCILHPRENAGRAYRARTPDGEISGTLPDLIGVQRFEHGKLWPLFPSYDLLEIELADGLWARFELDGDLFEMEDQRNWTDASFKTYSTPLTLGWPHRARAGQEIRQRVRLTIARAPRRARRKREERVRIELGGPLDARLPALGLAMASHGRGLSRREVELLRALRLDHLRADLRLSEEGWREELSRSVEAAGALGTPLELAVFLGDAPEAELEELAAELAAPAVPVARSLVFKEGEIVTASRWVRLARELLEGAAPGAAFAGGTDGWFADLNRGRPELDGLDGIAYSINAMVHADDDTSLLETPAAQGDTVRSARAFSGGRPILVGPVTIRPRSWPFGGLEAGGELPFQVDPRQCSLLGAGWTLASVKHLAEAGAASATYFETTGWRGVVETEQGSPLPERFPSRPGGAFPLYHVLADLGEGKDGEIVEARSRDPLAVEAVAVRTGGSLRLLIANFTPSPRRAAVGPLPAEHVAIRRLDEGTAGLAAELPEEFRAQREPAVLARGELELELSPFAVVQVEA